MALKGPIILVEDDANDAEVVAEAIKEIGVQNKVITFMAAEEAYRYLTTTADKPFFILCDIRMPVLDGLSFRDRIIKNPSLKKKSIPFVFFTGVVSQDIVNSAYDMDVQGFYQKEKSYEGVKEQLLAICLYWKASLHPNRDL